MTGPRRSHAGTVLVGGAAEGDVVVLRRPLSWWGGVDEDGMIIDPHHPQAGTPLDGTAVVMGATKGSSSSTSTLLECIRLGTAPALLLLTDPDPILVVGAAVGRELYGRGPSVFLLDATFSWSGRGRARLDPSGLLTTVRGS